MQREIGVSPELESNAFDGDKEPTGQICLVPGVKSMLSDFRKPGGGRISADVRTDLCRVLWNYRLSPVEANMPQKWRRCRMCAGAFPAFAPVCKARVSSTSGLVKIVARRVILLRGNVQHMLMRRLFLIVAIARYDLDKVDRALAAAHLNETTTRAGIPLS